MTNDIRSVATEAFDQAQEAAQTTEDTSSVETASAVATAPETTKTTNPPVDSSLTDTPKSEFEKRVRREDLPPELQSKYDDLNKNYVRVLSEKTTKYSTEMKAREHRISQLETQIRELSNRQPGNQPGDQQVKRTEGQPEFKTQEELDAYLDKREETRWVETQEKAVLQNYPDIFDENHPDFDPVIGLQVKAGVEALQDQFYAENKNLRGFDYVQAVKEVKEELDRRAETRSKEYHERQLAELKTKKVNAQKLNPGGSVATTTPAKGTSIRDIVQSIVDSQAP